MNWALVFFIIASILFCFAACGVAGVHGIPFVPWALCFVSAGLAYREARGSG